MPAKAKRPTVTYPAIQVRFRSSGKKAIYTTDFVILDGTLTRVALRRLGRMLVNFRKVAEEL